MAFAPTQKATSFNLSAVTEALEKKWRLMPRRSTQHCTMVV